MARKRLKNNVNTPEDIYHGSAIRMTSIVFGSIFSNLHVHSYNKNGSLSDKEVLVPIAYTSKEQYALWLDQAYQFPTTETAKVSVKLPRMSFELTSIAIVSDGNTINTNLPIYSSAISANGKTLRSNAPIPYQFDYTLTLWCKHMDESIQLLDQILPMFNPHLNIKLKESKRLNIVNDVKIVLADIVKNDNYQEGLENNRIIEWNLTFNVYADIMPEPEESSVIQDIVIETIQANTEEYLNGKEPSWMNTKYGIITNESLNTY